MDLTTVEHALEGLTAHLRAPAIPPSCAMRAQAEAELRALLQPDDGGGVDVARAREWLDALVPLPEQTGGQANYALDRMLTSLADGNIIEDDLKTSDEPLVVRYRRWVVLSSLIPTGSGRREEPWGKAAMIEFGDDSDKARKKLYEWWNKKSQTDGPRLNQIDPYDQNIATGAGSGSGVTLNEGISLLKTFCQFVQGNYPWLRDVDGKVEVRLPRLRRGDSSEEWWLSQIQSEKVKSLLLVVNTMKGTGSKSHKAVEMLQILNREGGLSLRDGNAAKAALTDAAADEGIVNVNPRFLFYQWQGVEGIGEHLKMFTEMRPSYPAVSDVADLFREYCKDDNVQLVLEALGVLAKAQADMVRAVLAGGSGLADVNEVWCEDRKRDAKAFVEELQSRFADPNLKCAGGDKCGCEALGLFFEMTCDLDHVGKEGKKKKRELMQGGAPKQPAHYTKSDMDAQREFLRAICSFFHRLVTASGRKNAEAGRPLIHKSYLKAIGGSKCFVSGTAVGDDTRAAYDQHHLAWGCNMQFGDVVVETHKWSQISYILVDAKSFPDLVENLFPETVLTCPVDCRLHKLIHLLINRPQLREKLGAEFPFVVEDRGKGKKKILKYTGELPQKWKELGERTIKLPSATDVLRIDTAEQQVSRRAITPQSRRKKSAGARSGSVHTEESEEESGSELELSDSEEEPGSELEEESKEDK